MNFKNYKAYPKMDMKNRKWPDNALEKAPAWCSVDLRDGNQALEIPMSLEQKLEFFKYLVDMGFKDIEIGFPAASDTEYKFAQELITKNLIPDGIFVQVLTQSREHIIKKTFEALKGAKNAVIHLYNSTSTLQRDVVFNNSKEETIRLAEFGAELILECSKDYPETNWVFEYSPESFTGTEMDFAVDICNAVINVWKPTADKKVIINLPATVEMSMPNVYADQIEYMCENLVNRENVLVSLHTHNDRGTAVAATELALLAGADRVEGTLFGNGERTGNSDILTLAMNIFSQGIDPKLDFSDIQSAIDIYEKVTGLPVNPRHPYAGDLVYTAFSGSHQDAINKGINKLKERGGTWEVPYLPIDPVDVGRNYDPIIRINSQSGKGGLAFILEQNYGLKLPKTLQQSFSKIITKLSDESHQDISSKTIYDVFVKQYLDIKDPINLIYYRELEALEEYAKVSADLIVNNEEICITGEGNGIVDAFCNAIKNHFKVEFEVSDYSEHSLNTGAKSKAISYVAIELSNKDVVFGAGISSSITKSSLRGIVSAVNKIIKNI